MWLKLSSAKEAAVECMNNIRAEDLISILGAPGKLILEVKLEKAPSMIS